MIHTTRALLGALGRPLKEPLRRARRLLGARIAFLATGVLLHGTAFLLWVWFWLMLFYAPGGALVPLALGLASVVPAAWLHRLRFAAYVRDAEIPRVPPLRGGYGLVRGWLRMRSRPYWRQAAHHFLAGIVMGIAEAAVLTLLVGSVAAATVYAWEWALPDPWRDAYAGYSTQIAFLMIVGVVGLLIAPRTFNALIRVEQPVVTRLLGPSRAEELERRVEDLAERRAETVAAADAERRRIERDLHDGAQQRLVSLAVNLGLARATLTDLAPEARQVIDEAHREAKAAIEEIQLLVRGLHPAVLEDRGLDAALSGIAARAPLPVRLTVSLEERPAPAVEAVAYFVVSEALANVTKHAGAEGAEVSVVRSGGILQVIVSDDGVGGADPAGGSGLDGLRRRVASVDGTFSISSPRGGPTVVTVELPCVL
ncbi:sensor histidine kinase [Streptomyces kanamyceticus]|uniref:histidine kinase n=1 Tax=Streptomyces kanamyceticus TaxID=1967 RepID=A0A5J6GPJ5_STRKN|nr:sensor histidine kinase [Streptomyces kanamyceticus]QEU96342.1 sensor histidine kinase [Streptomyces kanamyceticus]